MTARIHPRSRPRIGASRLPAAPSTAGTTRVPHPHTAPSVFMAGPDGTTVIDVIAVERVTNGHARGHILTPDERRYAAYLMLDHLPHSIIVERLGISGATLLTWFPHLPRRRTRPRTPATVTIPLAAPAAAVELERAA
ncbi:hypothetical protein SRB5_51600 [Streptomyces sp. RB5]|uniref:Uncharacterized protein n=1 Tax=Streptomyces smaragdinus TaxID=2585196 RepID=A0A7K0CNX4_9ACTN|nr:hypothetical protein [Streptomyces smaragdinus]MQY14983.1 hypothetical protein [Streptomyces smaragdinus]